MGLAARNALCVVALFLPGLPAVGELLALAADVLPTFLVVGANSYYMVPARNFWLEIDWSPDGLEIANPVQVYGAVVLGIVIGDCGAG